MISRVELSKAVERQIKGNKLPGHVVVKLQAWVDDVETRGVEEVRKIPGYHDEPCKGDMTGYRSIRLSRSWRAYYGIKSGEVKFILIERVDKHEY